jgi:hypothetical protein
MRIQNFLISCLLAVTALSAYAFVRTFPAHTKRGVMTPADYPAIIINDRQRTLSVGARIRNQTNTIDMPTSLRGQDIVVNYTENNQHEIDRIWILTPEEAAQPAPNRHPEIPAPISN